MSLSGIRRFLSLVLILAIAASAKAADLTIKPGDQVIIVDIQNEQQLKKLDELDLDIWSHEYGVGPVEVHASVEQRKGLTDAGMTFTVKNANLFAERQRELAELAVRSPGDFTAYKDLAGIVAYINGLQTARPDLCQVSQFGTTVESRPMYVLRITGPNPGPKPAVFYHGLIHAREWIAGSVAMYLAEHLVNNYDTDPCIKALVDTTEIYIAPCVNPDGYNYTWTNTRLWRKNRRNNGDGSFGIDNNRNFGYQWGAIPGGGSSGTPSSETYRGPSAFSEPETQAIRDFILNNPNIKAYMDYHSYSQLLMWAWGYTATLSPDNARFAAIGNYMQQLITAVNGFYYEPGPINTTIYQANGTSVDWAYGAANRFAYTIELRDTGATGFMLPADQITPTCLENVQGILYLTRWASSGVLLDLNGGAPGEIAAGQTATISVNINNAQENYVGGSALLHYRFNPGDAYSTVPFSFQSGTTYAASLPAASCGQTAQFYVTASGSGGYSASLPCTAPATVYSAPVVNVVPPQVFHDQPLTSNPGWTLGTGWAYGAPTGTCGDPNSGHTGANVYGYNLAGCYTNSIPVRYLTTTAINCSGFSNTQLSFWRWLGLESAQFDHANIQASSNGTTWTTIWNFTGGTLSETSWSLQTYDISAVADGQSTVYIRWGMGPADGGVVGCGWNIDDVQILGNPVANCGAIPLGDVNHDGGVDALDISPFVQTLLNPGAATANDTCAADVNQNCGVTMEDVDPFVGLLLVP